MNIYLDTEFYEDGPEQPVRLISIAMVDEYGRHLYYENSGFDWSIVPDNHWVQKNVRPHLLTTTRSLLADFAGVSKALCDMAPGIKDFCLRSGGKPVFHAYFSAYDWLVFCQIFGRMVDLPESYPMYCIDLKQMMHERGLDEKWKERVCPDPTGEHNALVDARWNKDLHDAIKLHDANMKTFKP